MLKIVWSHAPWKAKGVMHMTWPDQELCNRLLAVAAAGASAAVMLGEATISPHLPNLSVFSHAIHAASGNPFSSALLTLAFLCYPCVAAYYALFKLARSILCTTTKLVISSSSK